MPTLAEIDAEIARRQQSPNLSAIDAELLKRGVDVNNQSANQPIEGQPQDDSFLGAGVIEPLATVVTGAIAEPLAGLAGIIQTLNPLADEGAGAKAVKDVRSLLTKMPETEQGIDSLQNVGEFLSPAVNALKDAEKFLGDEAFEATGSPAIASMATTIPTALLEVLGLASSKGIIKASSKIKKAANAKEVTKSTVEAAPSIEQLKNSARSIYKELDDSGIQLRQKPFKGLVNKVNQVARKMGARDQLTPKTNAVLKEFNKEIGNTHTLTDIDGLRRVAQNAAKSTESADAAIGSAIVDNIDKFLDNVSPTAFTKGSIKQSDVSKRFTVARDLWGRSKRSELINDAFDKAKNQASGFENGVVVQFRQIINNKNKSKFFKKNELDVMKEVVRGTKASNFAKLIGRLGFSEGHATNIIGGSLGIVGGSAIGGTAGAVAVPLIGQLSRKLAQRLTVKKAEFADTIVRAGTNADEIVKGYIKYTPKKARSSSELSELLTRPDIALDNLKLQNSKLVGDALDIAKGQRIINNIGNVSGSLAPTIKESTQE